MGIQVGNLVEDNDRVKYSSQLIISLPMYFIIVVLASVSSAIANGSPAPSPPTDGEADANTIPSCYDLIGVEQVRIDQCNNACIDQGHAGGGLSGDTVDNPNPNESSLKEICSCGSKDGEYVGVLCEQVIVVPTCSSMDIAISDDCSIYCTSLFADPYPFMLSASSFYDTFGAECECSTDTVDTGDFVSMEKVCKDKSDFDGLGVAGDDGSSGGDNASTASTSAISTVLFFFAATAQMFT